MNVLKDIVILSESSPETPDRWILYNVHARTCLGVNSEVIRFLSGSEASPTSSYKVWKIGWFSNIDGLLADPSRFKREVSGWGESASPNETELSQLLRELFIVVDDESAYRARFTSKTSILDSRHFGNFHEQLGQQLLKQRRAKPSEWWLDQKFSADRTCVRADNLYGGIQASYLSKYFPQQIRSTDTVADIGCGTGYYSNMIAATGAKVIGVDPSDEYLDIARKHAVGNVVFGKCALGITDTAALIPDNSVDVVYMSDALLFYFVPYSGDQNPDISVLLKDIRRMLKPEGRFISVEPHYLFWLQPWLGAEDYPFTIISEYKNMHYRVTASISTLIQTLSKGGFAVTWMEEILPSEAFEKVDKRAYGFAREFPLWQLYELRKA